MQKTDIHFFKRQQSRFYNLFGRSVCLLVLKKYVSMAVSKIVQNFVSDFQLPALKFKLAVLDMLKNVISEKVITTHL